MPNAETTGDGIVPVLVFDVSESETVRILATHKPVGAMAGADPGKLSDLLATLDTQSAAVQALFDSLVEQNGIFDVAEAAMPELPTGDKSDHEQITLSLSIEHRTFPPQSARGKAAT